MIKLGMEKSDSNHNSIELDKIDRLIIERLRKDGRASFAQIAQELNVSAGMIRVRYNRLVDSGCLKVVAITDPLQMGFETMAMIGIRVDGDRLMEVANKIAAFDEVIYLVITSGSYDILAEIRAHDHTHLLTFLTDKLYKITGVRESESFLHLKIMKEIYF
jgi:Lrp/AsnC family transcriptional regulator for asnA, asnC and gidA